MRQLLSTILVALLLSFTTTASAAEPVIPFGDLAASSHTILSKAQIHAMLEDQKVRDFQTPVHRQLTRRGKVLTAVGIPLTVVGVGSTIALASALNNSNDGSMADPLADAIVLFIPICIGTAGIVLTAVGLTRREAK